MFTKIGGSVQPVRLGYTKYGGTVQQITDGFTKLNGEVKVLPFTKAYASSRFAVIDTTQYCTGMTTTSLPLYNVSYSKDASASMYKGGISAGTHWSYYYLFTLVTTPTGNLYILISRFSIEDSRESLSASNFVLISTGVYNSANSPNIIRIGTTSCFLVTYNRASDGQRCYRIYNYDYNTVSTEYAIPHGISRTSSTQYSDSRACFVDDSYGCLSVMDCNEYKGYIYPIYFDGYTLTFGTATLLSLDGRSTWRMCMALRSKALRLVSVVYSHYDGANANCHKTITVNSNNTISLSAQRRLYSNNICEIYYTGTDNYNGTNANLFVTNEDGVIKGMYYYEYTDYASDPTLQILNPYQKAYNNFPVCSANVESSDIYGYPKYYKLHFDKGTLSPVRQAIIQEFAKNAIYGPVSYLTGCKLHSNLQDPNFNSNWNLLYGSGAVFNKNLIMSISAPYNRSVSQWCGKVIVMVDSDFANLRIPT